MTDLVLQKQLANHSEIGKSKQHGLKIFKRRFQLKNY